MTRPFLYVLSLGHQEARNLLIIFTAAAYQQTIAWTLPMVCGDISTLTAGRKMAPKYVHLISLLQAAGQTDSELGISIAESSDRIV